MADKLVPSLASASDMDKIVAMLKSQALPKQAAACAQGADTPDEADALKQGKGAGSTVAEAKLVVTDDGNANAMPVLEVGDDPAKAKDGPNVTTSNADGIEELCKSGDTMVIKQASTMADKLDALDKQLLHLAAAEVVAELAVKHQAEMEEAAIGEAVPEIQASLDVDPETAAQIAQAILDGDIPEEDMVQAVEQNQNLKEIAAATGATPEDVLAIAEQLGAEAEATGKPVEQIVQEAMGELQKQAMAEAHKDYNALDAVEKKASSEGDAFTARMAQKRKLQIENWLDSLGPVHEAGACEKKEAAGEDEVVAPDEEEVAAAEAAPADSAPAETEVAAEETAPEVGPPGDEAGMPGPEGLAAGMMAQQVAPEQLQMVEAAITALVESGIPPELIAQAVQERMAGQVPDLTKVASAEDLEKDPKLMAHVAIDMAIRKAATSMKKGG
jgi:hypothetical protein